MLCGDPPLTFRNPQLKAAYYSVASLIDRYLKSIAASFLANAGHFHCNFIEQSNMASLRTQTRTRLLWATMAALPRSTSTLTAPCRWESSLTKPDGPPVPETTADTPSEPPQYDARVDKATSCVFWLPSLRPALFRRLVLRDVFEIVGPSLPSPGICKMGARRDSLCLLPWSPTLPWSYRPELSGKTTCGRTNINSSHAALSNRVTLRHPLCPTASTSLPSLLLSPETGMGHTIGGWIGMF